jgi:acyl transferase domain-containing protein
MNTSKKEPIAIIGIGCRFPGSANNPEAFWKLLRDSVDAITEVPEDRWNLDNFYDPGGTKPGKIRTRWGGFVDKIDEFDGEFFGISPREASCMDPQQRLLLEVAWEALEDGGQVPENLAGSKTGVFIGISSSDYYDIQLSASDRDSINAYTNLGGAHSVTANRISYILNLNFPPWGKFSLKSLIRLHR